MTESAITAETTVNDAIRKVPTSLAIFAGCGIDSCCGGALPIGEAARRHGLDAEELLERIRGNADVLLDTARE